MAKAKTVGEKAAERLLGFLSNLKKPKKTKKTKKEKVDTIFQQVASEIQTEPQIEDVLETAQKAAEEIVKTAEQSKPAYTRPAAHTRPQPEYYSPWQRNEGFLQPDHMTRLDRFPKIFETAQKFKPDAKRILSFGCSTGEECQSLRKYFPNAEIVGVDLDWHSVSKARKTNKDRNIFFHTDLGATGKYDLVLCLMVFFCMDLPVVYKKFEGAVKNVNKHINEDGYLMIYTSDHHPGWVDEIATLYEPVNEWQRIHDKNKKEYYNGYYRKLRSEELPKVV